MSKIEVELVPIRTPNYILVKAGPKPRQEGFSANCKSYHVSELSKETLSDLAGDFRKRLFLKAGFSDE